MVFMKFKDKKMVMEWRKEFDGWLFDILVESEICYVMFIKSIIVEILGRKGSEGVGVGKGEMGMINFFCFFLLLILSLVELFICVVCFERMDDMVGLMMILC